MLHDSDVTTLEFVKKIMLAELPLIPDISFPMADVRDVAEAHEKAMVKIISKNMLFLFMNLKLNDFFN